MSVISQERAPRAPLDKRSHDHHGHHGHAHGHGHEHGHGDHAHHGGIRGFFEGIIHPHSHDAGDRVDAALESSEQGIRAVKLSVVILAIATTFQMLIVAISGSVALLADSIHNFGHVLTTIPLWIAFVISRRLPTKRYTYGYHRSEDVAGIFIVLVVLFSAVMAAWEAVDRLLHPLPIGQLGWVMAAGVVGFLGNEAIAIYRIRVGKRISSAALVADGYHARMDGFAALAVVLGSLGVLAGWPIVDPIVGLGISAAILWMAVPVTRDVFRRVMDGVEPELVDRLTAAGQLYGVRALRELRVRWSGHRLEAEIAIAVDAALSTHASYGIAEAVKRALLHAEPKLRAVAVRVIPESA